MSADALMVSIEREQQPFVPSEAAAAQRTVQWLYERVGYCTASKFGDVLSSRKDKKEAAPRRNYRVKLAVERLLNEPQGSYVSDAMQWGIDREDEARMAYEARTGALIEVPGFIHHKSIEWCGGSPDGLIEADGGIEIKCPYEPAVHVETLMARACEEHLPQIQGLMWITGRKWWDFVSFDPRMPKGVEIYVQRVARDEKYIAALELAVIDFLAEVDAQHKAFMEMVEKAAA